MHSVVCIFNQVMCEVFILAVSALHKNKVHFYSGSFS